MSSVKGTGLQAGVANPGSGPRSAAWLGLGADGGRGLESLESGLKAQDRGGWRLESVGGPMPQRLGQKLWQAWRGFKVSSGPFPCIRADTHCVALEADPKAPARVCI